MACAVLPSTAMLLEHGDRLDGGGPAENGVVIRDCLRLFLTGVRIANSK